MKTLFVACVVLWFSIFIEKTLSANSITLPLYGNKINNKNDKVGKQVYINNQDKSYSIKIDGDIVQILTNINVGGVNQQVIVDSGSVLLVVPSTLCKNCKQAKPYYQSSPLMEYMDCETKQCKDMGNTCIEFRDSNKKVCGNGVHYLQNTEIITILVKDTFSFSNQTGDVLATFGAIVSNTGRPLEHGILGMGKTCNGCRKSPVENIFEETDIPRIFSMWLDNDYQGVMNLGQVDERYQKSIKYTPMVTIEESHYGVYASSATVQSQLNNDSLVLVSRDFGQIIIDTGTSEALLESSAYSKIKAFLQKDCRPSTCGQNNLLEGFCYNYPDEYFDSFPTINLQMLGGAYVDIAPTSYITSTIVNGIKYRCFGIKESPLKGKSIIGLSWLRNNYLVFDTEHNRMGFSSKDLNDEFETDYQDTTQSVELKPQKKKYVVKITDENQLREEYEKEIIAELNLEEQNYKNKQPQNNNDDEQPQPQQLQDEDYLNNTPIDIELINSNEDLKTTTQPKSPTLQQLSNYDIIQSLKSSKSQHQYLNQSNIDNNIFENAKKKLNTGKPIKLKSKNPIILQYDTNIPSANTNGVTVSFSKNTSFKSIVSITTACKFGFSQKKDFQWIDNNAKFYTFWESTIENLSTDQYINKFELSTMDNVQYVIGMDYQIVGSTTNIKLPLNTTISPGSSYRWIYVSIAKDALSFSVGTCNVV